MVLQNSPKRGPWALEKLPASNWLSAPQNNVDVPAAQLRWNPMDYSNKDDDFISGMKTFATNGDAQMRSGSAVHVFTAKRSMDKKYFSNFDGDLLIVPQEGRLELRTEYGIIDLEPSEIAVIQRGIKFQVNLPDGKARGYVLEIYGAHLVLPVLGPIGSSGLANSRDFETPVAAYEDKTGDFILACKFGGNLFEGPTDTRHSMSVRLAWKLCPLQVRFKEIHDDQYCEFRPSGSFDIHCIDLAR